IGQCHGHNFSLTLYAGGGEARFHGAIIIDSATLNNGMDYVTIRESILQPLQEHHAGAFTEDCPSRFRVKCTAVPVGRLDPTVFRQIAAQLWHSQRNAASQRHVTLSCKNVLASHMNGDERRRAEGLNAIAWAPQV